jgi:methionyl-tRNA formyltransferase
MTNAGHIANGAALTAMVKQAAPDLIVSFQFGFIFKPEALAVPGQGSLNLHSGALPLRAGVNPTFWCMKDRDSHAACTLHWIDHGIDSGNLVEVRPMPIDYSRSFFANWTANYRNGADLIGDTILALGDGKPVASTPQVAEQRVYVPTPTPDDFKAFFATGSRLIDPDDFMGLLSNYLPPV